MTKFNPTKPLGHHVGDDYARVLNSPNSHTEDCLAAVYGEHAARYAQLFAAAPDMLAALEGLCDAIRMPHNEDAFTRTMHRFPVLMDTDDNVAKAAVQLALENARATLAKVTGQ